MSIKRNSQRAGTKVASASGTKRHKSVRSALLLRETVRSSWTPRESSNRPSFSSQKRIGKENIVFGWLLRDSARSSSSKLEKESAWRGLLVRESSTNLQGKGVTTGTVATTSVHDDEKEEEAAMDRTRSSRDRTIHPSIVSRHSWRRRSSRGARSTTGSRITHCIAICPECSATADVEKALTS